MTYYVLLRAKLAASAARLPAAIMGVQASMAERDVPPWTTQTKHPSKRQLELYRHAFKLLAAAAFVLLATGTVVYRVLEDWSWVDSLYFSVVAVTTVGFGDLTPSSDASKLFTVVYILAGITIVTTYLNNRFKYRAYRKAEEERVGAPTESPD